MTVLSACAVGVSGPGYDGYDGVGYVGGYYEPWGYDYGGWGGRYRVGPPRGGYGHEGGFGHDGAHGSPGGRAGGARPAPSIPGRPRR
jgi:hypothetical protein